MPDVTLSAYENCVRVVGRCITTGMLLLTGQPLKQPLAPQTSGEVKWGIMQFHCDILAFRPMRFIVPPKWYANLPEVELRILADQLARKVCVELRKSPLSPQPAKPDATIVGVALP